MAGSTQVVFTPSVSVSLPTYGAQATTVTLPSVDSGNVAVLLMNLGPGNLVIVAGVGLQDVYGAPGSITLPVGKPILSSAAVLTGGTSACLQSHSGATLQFMRGSTADLWLLPSPAAVIV